MSGRILIADNVATNRIILKVKLAAASYDVAQVSSGSELMTAAQRDKPDLIVIDADLPGCDSFELCQQLANQPETAAIPVMMTTSDYGPDIRLRALQAGSLDILPKSLDDNVLLARVRNLLRLHSMEQELRRREGTAADFGFHEAPAEFTARPQVLLVNDPGAGTPNWQHQLGGSLDADIQVVADRNVLKTIAQSNACPDVIILPINTDPAQSPLTLVAELRSRAETRHCAIISSIAPSAGQTGISALDIGANDLMETDSLPAEAALRITNQLERKQSADRLRMAMESGMRLAVTDPLTGLYNRRYALPHTAKIAARAHETGQPFAVMVLDLDRFKRINDTYGHTAGDAVLQAVARRLRNNLRSVDLICRIGGEEFLVVMPDTDMTAARAAAERLRRVTQAEPVFVATDKPDIPVTLSIGVSIGGLDGQGAIPVETIVESADQALLGAKTHGRNQVIFGQSAA
ncbi:MAG: diguanylate cyclase [Marinosulfonomonas sp.]|nr:diguanylate cyclase [Marinosulfonomonas sp.]